MAYCGKCGAQLKEGAKFCPKCGQPTARNATNDFQNSEPLLGRNEEQGKGKSKFVLLIIIFGLLIAPLYTEYIETLSKKAQREADKKAEEEADKRAQKAEWVRYQRGEASILTKAEEESKPDKKFYEYIKQGYVWESNGGAYWPNYHYVLYFYPINGTAGRVCLVAFDNDYSHWTRITSGYGNYIVNENALDIDIEFEEKFGNSSDRKKLLFKIEDNGNRLKRVGSRFFGGDPIKKYLRYKNPLKGYV